MDIHEAKGKRAQKWVEKTLRANGMASAVKFAGNIAHDVAKDSRLEQARRVKKAKKHARTLDVFNDT